MGAITICSDFGAPQNKVKIISQFVFMKKGELFRLTNLKALIYNILIIYDLFKYQ